MSELLTRYESEFPGFLDYFQRLLTQYFKLGPRTHPLVAERMESCLRSLGPEVSRKALEELAQTGLFQSECLVDDRQVAAFWSSPLVGLVRSAVAYAPTLDDDLVGSFPPQAAGMDEHLARQVGFRNTQLANSQGEVVRRYWSESLKLAAPELYLWPFLQGRDRLHGLDLGCGWGRGALGMRDYSNLRMTAVDIAEEDLDLLRHQATKAGLADKVEACRADVTKLPFPADSFDFGLSYLVLDLLSDDALREALGEILRCLKPDSPFYVDMPSDYFNGAMQLQKQTARGFLELLHSMRAHGKVFQLAFYDLRVARQYTFAVLDQDTLEFPSNGRRPSWLIKDAAARLKGEAPPARPSPESWRRRLAEIRTRR